MERMVILCRLTPLCLFYLKSFQKMNPVSNSTQSEKRVCQICRAEDSKENQVVIIDGVSKGKVVSHISWCENCLHEVTQKTSEDAY